MNLQKQNPPAGVGSASAFAEGAECKYGTPLETLLQRLDCVRNAGRGYRARCPSCGGKSEKVSVTEADNGAVLLHAFCGCSPAAVLGAVGLQLADLFPIRLKPLTKAERREARRAARESGWRAALDVIAEEAAIIEIAGHQLALRHCLTPEDANRFLTAVDRVCEARSVLNGR